MGQSEVVTGPGVEISQIPHIVYFLEDEETLLKVPSMLPLLLGTVKSPRVPVSLENQRVTVLLDTGAEVSVIPKTLMQTLIGDGSKHVRLGQTKSVRPFANPDVQLEGPWGLTIEICGVRLIHPIYSMDADILAVVGIDLPTPAKLVIDAATTEQPVVPVMGQSEVVTGPGVEISQIPHIVYFLEDEETLLKVPSMLPLLLGTVKSPRVPVSLENQRVTVLLDTGAEVSVIPKTLMQTLIGDRSKHVRLGQTKSVRLLRILMYSLRDRGV